MNLDRSSPLGGEVPAEGRGWGHGGKRWIRLKMWALTTWLCAAGGIAHRTTVTSRRTLVARRMRQSMNGTELRLWLRLRGRKVDGWKFRRQQPLGEFYVDFCCLSARLVIELQGPAHDHDAQWAHDQRRFAWLEAEGYRVMRINVGDVDVDFDGVMESIHGVLVERETLGFDRRRRSSTPS